MYEWIIHHIKHNGFETIELFINTERRMASIIPTTRDDENANNVTVHIVIER